MDVCTTNHGPPHQKDVSCDPSRHLQESLGPPGPKSQKSLKKGLLGGLEKSLEKYPKKARKIPKKNTQKGPKIDIFRLFRVFFETFRQTPQKTLFETFFAISGPERPETPVNGGSGRKTHLPVAPVMGRNSLTPGAVFEGVPFMGVQALRWKRLIVLHEQRACRTAKMK